MYKIHSATLIAVKWRNELNVGLKKKNYHPPDINNAKFSKINIFPRHFIKTKRYTTIRTYF